MGMRVEEWTREYPWGGNLRWLVEACLSGSFLNRRSLGQVVGAPEGWGASSALVLLCSLVFGTSPVVYGNFQ